MSRRCICGCGRKAVQMHHVIYQQQLRLIAGEQDEVPRNIRETTLVNDSRNLVPVAHKCHHRHHSRHKPFRLGMLPDSVFEFAAEVMELGAAYEYLYRRYDGQDPRLDALLARLHRETA